MKNLRIKIARIVAGYLFLSSPAYSQSASLILNPLSFLFGTFSIKAEGFIEDRNESIVGGFAYGNLTLNGFYGTVTGFSLGYRSYVGRKVNTLFAGINMNLLFVTGYIDSYNMSFTLFAPGGSVGIRVGGKLFVEGAIGISLMIGSADVEGISGISFAGYTPTFNFGIGFMF